MADRMKIKLRITQLTELEQFFLFQLDEEAGYLAAFMPKDHTNKEAFINKYTRLLADPTITMRTILVDGEIAGSVSKFVMEGDAEITYWIDKKFWGQGIASKALTDF